MAIMVSHHFFHDFHDYNIRTIKPKVEMGGTFRRQKGHKEHYCTVELGHEKERHKQNAQGHCDLIARYEAS